MIRWAVCARVPELWVAAVYPSRGEAERTARLGRGLYVAPVWYLGREARRRAGG